MGTDAKKKQSQARQPSRMTKRKRAQLPDVKLAKDSSSLKPQKKAMDREGPWATSCKSREKASQQLAQAKEMVCIGTVDELLETQKSSFPRGRAFHFIMLYEKLEKDRCIDRLGSL